MSKATHHHVARCLQPVVVAVSLGCLLASCGGGEEKTLESVNSRSVSVVVNDSASSNGSDSSANVPEGVTISREVSGVSEEVAKAGDSAVSPVLLESGQVIVIKDENGRLGGDGDEGLTVTKFDKDGIESTLAEVVVQVEGDAKRKTVSVVGGVDKWTRIEIAFAGMDSYTLIVKNQATDVTRNACAPAIPKAGSSVEVDYTYIADTDQESPTGVPNVNGTIYPNGKTTATLSFSAGQGGAINLTTTDSNSEIALYHPKAAIIDGTNGRVTSFTTADTTATQALVGFGYESPPSATDEGPDWRTVIAAQNIQPGEAIQPIQVNMIAKGKIPKLLDSLYGPGLVQDDNTIVVTMNVTGERLADEKLTIDGKEIDTCRYKFKMRRTKHTIYGTNADKMNTFKGTEFESDSIGGFMPQLDGEFWSSGQIPWTVAQAKYHHVTGIGADATQNNGTNNYNQNTFDGVVIDPLNPTTATQQASEAFVVKSFTNAP